MDFGIKHNIGKIKYLLSYHDGVKMHQDGSKFYDIFCTNNKKVLGKSVKELIKKGYKQI
jgi:hypothetical protein